MIREVVGVLCGVVLTWRYVEIHLSFWTSAIAGLWT